MRTLGVVWTCLLGICALLPAVAQAQNKDKKKAAAATASPEEYKQLSQMKEIAGKLASSSAALLTLRIDIPHMEPNPNFRPPKANNPYQQMQELYRQQARIMQTADPFLRQVRMQRLMGQVQRQHYQQMVQAARANNGNNGPFKLVVENKDCDLEVSDKVVVRKMFLGTEYDDKGYIKEYTKEELAKLKGKDASKPGFEAKLADLAPGQGVKLFLSPRKADKKQKENEAKDDVLPGPVVTMIVILQEAQSAGMRNRPSKKN